MNKLQEASEFSNSFLGIQTARFSDSLKEIFSDDYRLSKVLFDGDKLTSAKVNTNEILDKIQMDAISFLADSWDLTFQISRSGAGMKIEFKLKEE